MLGQFVDSGLWVVVIFAIQDWPATVEHFFLMGNATSIQLLPEIDWSDRTSRIETS